MSRSLLFKGALYMVASFMLTSVQSQSTYKYAAKLHEVKTPGFYQIELLPLIVSKLQAGFQDLRIIDEKGNQVPYMLQSPWKIAEMKRSRAIDLPIVSKQVKAGEQTHIIAQNKSDSSINNLVVLIKNADASRTIAISGSDDLNEWYIIKENLVLDRWYADTADTYTRELLFPRTNYRYFKITIQGKQTLPLNIVRVSSYIDNVIDDPVYRPVPAPVIAQKDSADGYSYITLRFADFYLLNKLSLQVEGSKFFKRNLFISYDRDTEHSNTPFSLSSNEPMAYPLSYKTNALFLKIKNDDNPPLRLTQAKAYQLQSYLVTWLEKAGSYKLIFGDSSAEVPRYDLAFFKDSMSNKLAALSYSLPEENNPLIEKESELEGEKIWMWVIIAFVLLLVSFLTFRMTREVSNNS
jgi:hypothetical protein